MCLVRAASPAVVINELMWGGEEYVELWNLTAADVPLAGWSLERKQAGKATVTITVFGAGERVRASGFFLIVRSVVSTSAPADKTVSGLRLVDIGELVTLRDASGAVVDTANREGPWYAGTKTASMERKDPPGDGSDPSVWHTSIGVDGTRRGTPGVTNSPGNRPPAITLTLPESLTERTAGTFGAAVSDPDGDAVTVSWDFGDGGTGTGTALSHRYTRAGTYTVIATASDGVAEQNVQGSVAVTPRPSPTGVVVNEALPDPTGSDTAGEFLELFNTTSSPVDLGGAQLDDADGGSAPYVIPDGTALAGGAYLSFPRSETGLALNNDGDRARLLAPDGTLVSELTFGSSPAEGAAWARRTDGSADWTTTPTAGGTNLFTPLLTAEPEGGTVPSSPTPTPRTSPTPTPRDAARTVSLLEARALPRGARVRVTGVVAAPPNVLGRGVFYLAGPVPEPPALYGAGSGIQVFVSGGDLPTLALGDRVAVTGTMSTIRNELRIRAVVADVQRVGAGEPPASTAVSTGSLGESLEGTLVRVQGSISRLSGNIFELDDGSGAARVLVKRATGWTRPALRRGDSVTVTGIVSQSGDLYRILPRFAGDLRIAGIVAGSAAARSITDRRSLAAVGAVPPPADSRQEKERAGEAERRRAEEPTPVEMPTVPETAETGAAPVSRLPLPTVVAWSGAAVLGGVRLLTRWR